jgi:peptidoglycan/xylan/chitin deacetylase (PgdA/CDA1 family)
MSLSKLPQALDEGALPRRGVIITFDDGYADNLYNAKPILEDYDMPATVYVATGYIGQKREFWWDELEGLFLQPRPLPELLSLEINGTPRRWELGELSQYSEQVYQHHLRWTVAQKDDPSLRHSLYRSFNELLRPLSEQERRRILDELRAWARAEPSGRQAYQSLSADEVTRLADGGLLEVGAHTVSHSILSELTATEQREEIQQSKSHLEQILGRAVTSFSYPFGTASDYNAQTVSLVQEAGFTCACSNFRGVVRRDADRFQVPRFLVRDWDKDTFTRRLMEWLTE